jgi:hypothetical protein
MTCFVSRVHVSARVTKSPRERTGPPVEEPQQLVRATGSTF